MSLRTLFKIASTFAAFSMLSWLSGCTIDSSVTQNPAAPAVDVASSIISSHIFDAGAIPRSKTFRYQSVNVANNAVYSNLEIELKRTVNHISEYQSLEQTPGTIVRRENVGFGGMSPFTMTQQSYTQDQQPIFIKSYKIIGINNVSGNLFPLAVGNQLTYTFTAKVRHGKQSQLIQGAALYQVISSEKNYTYGDKQVLPGNIYIIRYTEAVGTNPPQILWQYSFSPRIGWIVQAVRYKDGAPFRVYSLLDAQSSLAYMKPPAQ